MQKRGAHREELLHGAFPAKHLMDLLRCVGGDAHRLGALPHGRPVRAVVLLRAVLLHDEVAHLVVVVVVLCRSCPRARRCPCARPLVLQVVLYLCTQTWSCALGPQLLQAEAAGRSAMLPLCPSMYALLARQTADQARRAQVHAE